MTTGEYITYFLAVAAFCFGLGYLHGVHVEMAHCTAVIMRTWP